MKIIRNGIYFWNQKNPIKLFYKFDIGRYQRANQDRHKKLCFRIQYSYLFGLSGESFDTNPHHLVKTKNLLWIKLVALRVRNAVIERNLHLWCNFVIFDVVCGSKVSGIWRQTLVYLQDLVTTTKFFILETKKFFFS